MSPVASRRRDWPSRNVRVGPFTLLLRSPLPHVMAAVDRLYREYPVDAEDGIVDYTVTVAPPNPLRRWWRPKIVLRCDVEVPFMAPMPASHGPLALEMGMNLQIAAGMRRYLLLHAAAVERDGRALLIVGASGSGKSTLSAVLGYHGWRFLGDEFALVDPDTGALVPFPRPISLKNAAIEHASAFVPADRFGPVFNGTIKGTIRHLLPPPQSIAAMNVPAEPMLLVAPRFMAGTSPTAREMGRTEAFVRLSQASSNYQVLGETGFEALWRLTGRVPAFEIAYASSSDAQVLIDRLWNDAG